MPSPNSIQKQILISESFSKIDRSKSDHDSKILYTIKKELLKICCPVRTGFALMLHRV